jgi:hypothetical protein
MSDNVIRWHDRHDTAARWSPEAKYQRMRTGQTMRELEALVYLALDNAPSEYCAPTNDSA